LTFAVSSWKWLAPWDISLQFHAGITQAAAPQSEANLEENTSLGPHSRHIQFHCKKSREALTGAVLNGEMTAHSDWSVALT
jgi:hypothetical protein